VWLCSTTQLKKAFDVVRVRGTILLTVGGLAGMLGIIFAENTFRNERLRSQ
jgi:hypothetical protein